MSIKQLYAQGYNSNPSEPGCVHRLFQLHGGRLDWLLCAATWMHHTGCNPVALSGGDAALYQTPSVHTAIPQTVGKGICIMPYRATSLVVHGYAPVCDRLRLQTLSGKLVLLNTVRCAP